MMDIFALEMEIYFQSRYAKMKSINKLDFFANWASFETNCQIRSKTKIVSTYFREFDDLRNIDQKKNLGEHFRDYSMYYSPEFNL